ncbi:ATP-binding protein [Ornithinibacillus halophilus]|uniref:histidine kinase n=1 Tax=Ornithinibacillus halophilus TaxID=930117 RepID=A0A1M5CGV4_9BACI|nr:ATP-binding protein [Ornithinibacillus halophilus]SHF53985.1 two-component system, sporulation sensor kinase A [Ornithinibacillus halophilus]
MEEDVKDLLIPHIATDLTSLPEFIQNWFEENSNDIFSIWDHKGRALFFSKSTEQILGYTLSDLVDITWEDLIAPDDITTMKKQLDKKTEDEQLLTVHLKKNDESYIWCECKIIKKFHPTTKSEIFISIIKDITDKKEVEEMMVRSEKMSVAGQLAAGVAHEIRNPLTSIKGFLQLLQAGVNRKEVYYKIMIDEIEKMEKITSELLYISKPLTDQKEEELVDEMIEDVVKLLKSQAKLKNITIKHVQSENATITCDRSQIKQVLLNLIKNAIEAMEENGVIQVIVQEVNNKIRVDVIDEGPGISEEVIHKLGEPFFTTKQNGTGLGLMITKQILDRHNATLDIIQNSSKGSTFRIKFK